MINKINRAEFRKYLVATLQDKRMIRGSFVAENLLSPPSMVLPLHGTCEPRPKYGRLPGPAAQKTISCPGDQHKDTEKDNQSSHCLSSATWTRPAAGPNLRQLSHNGPVQNLATTPTPPRPGTRTPRTWRMHTRPTIKPLWASASSSVTSTRRRIAASKSFWNVKIFV
jgi:hypothetical protein